MISADEKPMQARLAHASGQCTGKSKRSGKRCLNVPVTGAETCRMHNGRREGRPIVTGRWSKRLGKFAEDHANAEADRELLDFRRVIAGLDMICVRLGERATEHDTSEFRKRALQLFETASDAEDPMSAMRNLGEFLRDGVAEDRVFNELRVSYSTLAEKIRDANQVKLAKENAINVKDANAWIVQFLLTVRELFGVDGERQVRERVGQTVARAARN